MARRSAGGDERELALLLAGTRAARQAAAGRIVSLERACGPRRILALLAGRRMVALLAARLAESLDPDRREPYLSARREALTGARAAAMLHAAYAASLSETLAESHVRALVLKGPGLAERAHGDMGLRSVGDLDLLVDVAQLWPAAARLQALGYGAPADPVDRRGLPHLHLALRRRGHPTVELHHRVHYYESSFSAAMLARAAPGADGLLVADPADELAALALFYARDGFHGVRLLADLTAWWDRRVPAGAVGVLDEHARRHPELARAWRAASAAATELGGIPTDGLITATGPLDRHESLAVHLASWSQAGDREQLSANIALTDALLAPRGQTLAFLRRQRDAPTGSAIVHLAKFSARWTYALWRARRGPWDPLPAARRQQLALGEPAGLERSHRPSQAL